MAQVLIGALAVLIFAIPILAAGTVEWGQPVTGLRLSISIPPTDASANREVQVTLENVGDQNLLVPIGAVAGTAHPALMIYTTTADGKTHRILQGGSPGVAGAMKPWNISLRAQESYTVRMPIRSYFALDGSEQLETLILRRCQLWVELDQQSAECPVSNKLTRLPCWHGKVDSNTLRLPN